MQTKVQASKAKRGWCSALIASKLIVSFIFSVTIIVFFSLPFLICACISVSIDCYGSAAIHPRIDTRIAIFLVACSRGHAHTGWDRPV